VSRETVIELAEANGVAVVEKDLDFHDAYNADEMFLTSTSLCIVPVRTFSGAEVGESTVPGPVTQQLTAAYVELVGFDFIEQYLRHLPPTAATES
jgi:branched-chain amino acid aminotransferase